VAADTAFRALLLAESTLTAAVSSRVYQGTAPRSARKKLHTRKEAYITFHQIDNTGEHHQGGASGLTAPTFQVDVWAPTTTVRTTLKEAIRNAVDGYNGTISGIDVRGCFLEEKGRDSIELPESAQEKPIFRSTLQAVMPHAETAPTF
jgi:hypothetical protein